MGDDGLTAEQTATVQALTLSLQLENGRARGAGASSSGAAAGTAEQSARDVMTTFVNRQLGVNASGLAAGNSPGLGKRGADSSLEAAHAMAAGDHSARTSAMLNDATAASELERNIDKVPSNGQPALRTAIKVKGLVPAVLASSMLLMEMIDAENIGDDVKQRLLTTLQDCVKPVLSIDNLNEKFLKFVHFGYQSELSGKPNADVARAMFEGKQHSTIATVSKEDERDYALFLAAAKQQKATGPGSGKKDLPPAKKQKQPQGARNGDSGRGVEKARKECEHCGSFYHAKRDCDWYKLSSRDATDKRKAAQAQANKRGNDKGRR